MYIVYTMNMRGSCKELRRNLYRNLKRTVRNRNNLGTETLGDSQEITVKKHGSNIGKKTIKELAKNNEKDRGRN